LNNKLITLFFLIMIIGGIVYADSLWKEESKSPYVRNNPLKVGDIITVEIIESTTALQQAQTDLSKKSDVNIDISSSWERIANIVSATNSKSERHDNKAELSGGDDYRGKGQTTRKSVVKAKITVMVTGKIDDNIFDVEGTHQVKVNDEMEKIYIKGNIRKQDISNENTVFSNQIANVQISVEGNGTVSSKQNPGIMTRLFGWLF